jgi:hypothetical protein
MDGSSLDYYIQMNHIGALGSPQTFGDSNGTGFLMVSQSGDTRISKNLIVDGDISATSLNVTSITSSIVTSSILQTEGSNLFGDTITDTQTFNGHITASGDISASGDIFAHSGSFTYITASIVDVDGDTIRFGGEPFTKANIQTLKQGRTLKPLRVGKTKPDFEAEDGIFEGNITASGNISSSGTIIGNEFIGGTIQNTGSYDFPGAIVGYNVQGLNVSHAGATYSLTTSFAVPDAGLNVCFVAPKSGIVEIEVQIRADGGSSGIADLTLGLSDSDTYNSVASYYEQNVLGFPRFDHMNVVHKWIVPSLTPGTTYKYWLGAKASNTTGTPFLAWGGNSSDRSSDFIMKATALPSNTEIET